MEGNSKRRIASLALFRKLYDEGRSDVMTILCEFTKNIIHSKKLIAFNPTQIKLELKMEYGFNIPEYVVESILKKFCKKNNSKYYPIDSRDDSGVADDEIEQIERSHEVIFSKLVSFVEGKLDKNLDSTERELLFQSLCAFLIDDTNKEYEEYISAFILELQSDFESSKLLQTIKEGVVLYTGIQYNDSLNEIGSWNESFTIFVEQEILFHLAGYNGDLYQQLYSDFSDLIKEINRKARKQLVKIKYFDSVKIEIEKFFNIAERIVDGKETLDCSNIAMTSIVLGCNSKSDVIAKKCAFWGLLTENLISEERGDLYFNQNSKYNIFCEENLEGISKSLQKRDVEWSLKLLNYVNMIRAGKVSSFEKSKCILLTGNSTTMQTAFHSLIKQNGEVPLATTLDYITNKLWFKLNKGFGCDTYPKSFNLVTKAQIILSSQILGSVAQEFEKIKKEISDKSKNETALIAELAELKVRVKKPEEVIPESVDDVLETISMIDTERYLREREMEKQEVKEQKERNELLISSLNESKLKEKGRIRDQIDDIKKRQERVDILYTTLFLKIAIIYFPCLCLSPI